MSKVLLHKPCVSGDCMEKLIKHRWLYFQCIFNFLQLFPLLWPFTSKTGVSIWMRYFQAWHKSICNQSINYIHLNLLVRDQRILCAKFVCHWFSDAGEEYENCKEFSRWRRHTADSFWSDDSYVPSLIGFGIVVTETKNIFSLF